ncbi:MAG: NUDIX hydrolase [Patescibacteria group bacterium]|nr:NUDIX hydrolase [Patescibacteria group bacterium]
MRQLARQSWIVIGRLAYFITQPGIKLVVHGSQRTRVLVVCDDDYLVVKHWLGNNNWMLPGGGCHKNEAPLDAAQRELHEELGLDLGNEVFEHQGQYDCNDGGFRFSFDLYLVRLSERPQLQLQRIEILNAQWFSRTAVLPDPASPEVFQALANWPQ